MAKDLIIIKLPISSLKLDPNNARTHSEKNLKAICGSLKKFGQQKPIVVSNENVVVAGNGTLEAAKQLGWAEISAVKTDLNKTHSKAYALADNRSAELAAWDDAILGKTLTDLIDEDFDIAEIGFEAGDWDEPAKEGLTDDDVVPEIEQNIHGVTRGDIWQLGNHRLMCGDSTSKDDVDRLMAGEKADMVFTDPPYGVSYTEKNEYLNSIGGGHRLTNAIENDSKSVPEMFEFWKSIFNMTASVCGNRSSYYICSPQGGELMMMMMMQAIDQSPWSLKHTLIWNKNNHVLGRCDYHYKHEPILYGWKKKGVHDFYGAGTFTKRVWDVAKPHNSDLHPTMKPIELIENALANSTKPSALVIDVFLGSGSTLIACEKTNRKCYGMEIDPHYCSVIIERWQQFTNKKAIQADGKG